MLARCCALAARLDAGDETAWSDYIATITVINALVPAERRPLATTKEMAERLNVTPKTIRRWGRAGKLQHERHGARGTGAIRWRA
jgi:excisionase family DNA binding protein